MVERLTVTICARGGSERLPNKNILKINGLTLIELSIRQALELVNPENVIFSSDSSEYLGIASNYSVQLHKRGEELSNHKCSKVDVLKTLCGEVETKYIIDLDPTAPLRETKDLIGIYELLTRGKEVALGVCRMESVNPYFNMIEVKPGNLINTVGEGNYVRSQDVPDVFFITGLIGWEREYLLTNSNMYNSDRWGVYEMEEYKMYDIDTSTDYLIVKTLAEIML